MKRTVVAGVLACVVWAGAGVCQADDHGFEGKQCEVFEHCTAEQEQAAIDQFCEGRSVTTTVTTSTTSTTLASSVDGGFPTPSCPAYPATQVCHWTSKNGKRFKHCTVTGLLSAQCGGGSVRRDGSVVFGPHCVVREQ